MSLEDHPFRWIPSLQHIAKVKTIEMFWRNSVDEQVIMPKYEEYWGGVYTKLDYIELCIKREINRAPLPTVMKNDLNNFLQPMLTRAAGWIIETTLRMRSTSERNWLEVVRYFLTNFSWYNTGCIDGLTMFKGFVSKKETITFEIWKQLCFYCIEDDIIKFAKTIDWSNLDGEFDTCSYSFYWYHRIYGEFPADQMCDQDSDYEFKVSDNANMYGESSIQQYNLLYKSMWEDIGSSISHISAIRFFRNRIDNDEYSGISPNVLHMDERSGEVLFYFLREMDKEDLRKFIFEYGMPRGLARWPWIQFIDHWISALEFCKEGSIKYFYKEFFENFEFVSGDDRVNKSWYEPLKRVWRMFYERFSSHSRELAAASHIISEKHDPISCKFVFERNGE